MKKLKSWGLSIILAALFCMSSIAVYADHCTQKNRPCKNFAGVMLWCDGPVTSGPQCWTGGCGGPVGPADCSDDDPQQ